MQKYSILFIVISLCICAINISAQETERIEFSVNTGSIDSDPKYIREWLLLGPFQPDNLNEDFLLPESGEANINPNEGDKIAISDGASLSWKRYKSETDIIDLLDAVGNHENVVSYAFCILKSDISGEALFYAGSDDGIAVWINGEMTHRHTAGRALFPDKDIFRANLKAGDNRCLVKISQGTEAWGFSLKVDMSPANPAVLSGKITDETGQPIPDVTVYLEQDRKQVAQALTDGSGNYTMEIHPVHGPYDLYATKNESGDTRLNIPLSEDQNRRMNLTLRSAVKIEGTALMLDGETPHVACVVQAIVARRGDTSSLPVATALTDEAGKYKLVNLKPGSYQVRCHAVGGHVYYKEGRNFVSEQLLATPLRVRDGRTVENVNFKFAPLKKGTWKSYNSIDGLAFDIVRAVHRAPDGAMWFGTDSGGVSRYDGKDFMNFKGENGELHIVMAIDHDPDGNIWFGSDNGIARYNGNDLTAFNKDVEILKGKDGAEYKNVQAIGCSADGVIWFGTRNNGIFSYDGTSVANFTTENGLKSNNVQAIYPDADGAIWLGTGNGVSHYDKESFTSFGEESELEGSNISAIHKDSAGNMWFGTQSSGVFRYDGKQITNLTIKDGLANNRILSIYSAADGIMWFGTWGGASRYDGETFINFTKADGLPNNTVSDISSDVDGAIWFATAYNAFAGRGGVCKYDDSGFTSLTEKDGFPKGIYHRNSDGTIWGWGDDGMFRYDGTAITNLIKPNELAGDSITVVYGTPEGAIWIGTESGSVFRHYEDKFEDLTPSMEDGNNPDRIWCIYRDSNDVMWFGTYGSGVFRYDGEKFEKFIIADGDNAVTDIFAISSDSNGAMWFGTWNAVVFRYDGVNFNKFTSADGLAGSMVSTIYRDPNNVMWITTWGGGVFRYDENGFTRFTTEDGLASNFVFTIDRDTEGNMWVGTDGGGFSQYDGTAWTSLDTREGLLNNGVYEIHHISNGSLWLKTSDGLTLYSPKDTAATAQVVSVTTDKTYHNISNLPEFSVGTRVTIAYTAIDFKTIPVKRQYRCRIQASGKNMDGKETNADWGEPTKADSFDYTFSQPGNYTFEVQSIDRDLNYSTPASVSIVISSPPFYQTGMFLIILTIVGVGSMCGLIILGIYRMRSFRTKRLRLQRELEDACKMQTRLLPEKAPEIEGFDIAGTSQPAREVGGDFFDYFSLVGRRIGIAIADVSDKGLKGAMNAVLANGMLHEVVKSGTSCGGILSALNSDLHPRIEKHIFVSLGFAVLEQNGKTLYWANAAQPYPMLKRGEQIIEIKNTSELPLGMLKNVSYHDWEMDLQSGDIIIFYTDGIIEAENESGKMYGIERLERSIERMDPGRGAGEIIQHILHNVTQFAGNAEQYDDMTVVVVKKL